MIQLRVSYMLIALSVIPLLGGIARLLSLWGSEPTPDVGRFIEVATPLVVHIICASLFSVLGAFQFDDKLRVGHPGLHRMVGRVAALSGALAALTGVVLAVVSEIPKELQGALLMGARVAVGLAMLISILQGVAHIYAGRVAMHKAWMLRAYAIGQGAGTQAVLFLPLMLIMGHDVTGLPRDILMTAAWLINLGIAETIIGRMFKPRGKLVPQHA